MTDATPNTTYDPQGKGHWILSQLEHGSRDPVDVYDNASDQLEPSRARKMPYVMAALCVSGLVRRRASRVELTRKGAFALKLLDRGESYTMDRVIRIGPGREARAAA